MRRVLQFQPDPIGNPVAEGRADRSGDPYGPEGDVACTDYYPDADQGQRRWKNQRKDCKRFPESQYSRNGRRPSLMLLHKVENLLDKRTQAHAA